MLQRPSRSMMVYGRAECDAQTKTRDPIDRRRMLMALTTITCVQREAVDACHDINTLNVQMPLPPPKTTGICGFTI